MPLPREEWYLTSDNDVAYFVVITVYVDGEEMDTVYAPVPFLGQAIAAAQKSGLM